MTAEGAVRQMQKSLDCGRGLCLLVGTGLTIGATGDPANSWPELIKRGAVACEENGRRDLLNVAEECAARAHAIRSDIAGPFDADTRKTREMMLKVSAAWLVAKPTADQPDAAGGFVARFLREDLGLPPRHRGVS